MSITEDEIHMADQCNKIVRSLLNMLAAKNSSDAAVDRLRIRVNTAVNALPLVLLQDGGPYIWKYRYDLKSIEQCTDGIYSYNWEYFLTKDYSDNYNKNDNGASEIEQLIQMIKDVFASCTADEKFDIYCKVREYLAVYAAYRKWLKARGRPV